jgi:hypothetical protein
MSDVKQRAKESTQWLRTSPDPIATRLRILLNERRLNPEMLVLADCFPDDGQLWFGLLVTPDSKCIQFDFEYWHKSVEQGVFSEWVDLTDRFRDTAYRDRFSAAIELIGKI